MIYVIYFWLAFVAAFWLVSYFGSLYLRRHRG